MANFRRFLPLGSGSRTTLLTKKIFIWKMFLKHQLLPIVALLPVDELNIHSSHRRTNLQDKKGSLSTYSVYPRIRTRIQFLGPRNRFLRTIRILDQTQYSYFRICSSGLKVSRQIQIRFYFLRSGTDPFFKVGSRVAKPNMQQ